MRVSPLAARGAPHPPMLIPDADPRHVDVGARFQIVDDGLEDALGVRRQMEVLQSQRAALTWEVGPDVAMPRATNDPAAPAIVFSAIVSAPWNAMTAGNVLPAAPPGLRK